MHQSRELKGAFRADGNIRLYRVSRVGFSDQTQWFQRCPASPAPVRNRCQRNTDCGHEFCNGAYRALPRVRVFTREVSENHRFGESDPPQDPGPFTSRGSADLSPASYLTWAAIDPLDVMTTMRE